MKLYVLIRDDISFSQMAVQGGHVVSKIASKNPKINWDKQTFVYLKVSPFKLNKFIMDLSLSNIPFEQFIEPDMDNQITSIACLGHSDKFRKLNLL